MVRSPPSDRQKRRTYDKERRYSDDEDDRGKAKKSRRRSRSRSKERERDRYSDDRRRDDRGRDRERHRDKERDNRSRLRDNDDRRDYKDVKSNRIEEIHVKEEPIPWNEFPAPKPHDPNSGKPKEEEPVEKEKPSLKPSGKLLEDTNMVNGVVVKYVEPPEAKAPKVMWQLHPFRNQEGKDPEPLPVMHIHRRSCYLIGRDRKNQEGKDPEPLPVMHIHRRSCYLIGRDRKVVQFPMACFFYNKYLSLKKLYVLNIKIILQDHPSCSKQHAALQFRSLPYTKVTGERSRRTKPYIIDLESANGTFLNEDKLEPTRYYELKHGDEIKFGFSSRSFVVLNATAALNQMEAGTDIKKEESDDDEDDESSKDHVPKEDKFE
uniref:FHA domain-containing protein n=1 Tax=Panagrolaimus sp. ES5 TaxID=591445 RepID=A0AC34FW40_9BILA